MPMESPIKILAIRRIGNAENKSPNKRRLTRGAKAVPKSAM